MTSEEALKILTKLPECIVDMIVPSDYSWEEALDLAIKALEDQKPRGTYECFHCGSKSVVWQSDFDYSDFGYDGEGIVHICQCMNCGADIEYRIPIGDNEDESDNQT